MRLLIDAQLPPALARFLCDRGFDAVAARDAGLRDAEDALIWQWAKTSRTVIVTKDEDFVKLVLRHGAPPQVLWLRIGNATNAALLAWLEPVLPMALAALGAGDALVEVL